MNARDAADLADEYAQMILNRERDFSKEPYAREYIDSMVNAVLTGTEPVAPPALLAGINAMNPRIWYEVQAVGLETAMRRLWQRHRVIYAIDPDLWRELGDSDLDDTIPPDVFTRLPHPDPFVAFPEPIELPMNGGQIKRVGGFFVRGDAQIPGTDDPMARMQVSTHDPQSTGLGLLFVAPMYTATGRPVRLYGIQDATLTRITLNPRAGGGRVADMIDATLRRFNPGGSSDENWHDNIPRMVRRAVSLLVYLCTVDADVVPAPRAAVAGRRPGAGGPKPAKVLTVGYRVGRALRAYRAREQEDRAAAVASGRTVAPHVRRAHFHTYRTGKGRTDRVVKWLPPIPVNVDGPAEVSTVVRVPGRAAQTKR